MLLSIERMELDIWVKYCKKILRFKNHVFDLGFF